MMGNFVWKIRADVKKERRKKGMERIKRERETVTQVMERRESEGTREGNDRRTARKAAERERLLLLSHTHSLSQSPCVHLPQQRQQRDDTMFR